MSRGKTKTSSSQALEVENEPLATETIIDEMDDDIENKQGQRHMQYFTVSSVEIYPHYVVPDFVSLNGLEASLNSISVGGKFKFVSVEPDCFENSESDMSSAI